MAHLVGGGLQSYVRLSLLERKGLVIRHWTEIGNRSARSPLGLYGSGAFGLFAWRFGYLEGGSGGLTPTIMGMVLPHRFICMLYFLCWVFS